MRNDTKQKRQMIAGPEEAHKLAGHSSMGFEQESEDLFFGLVSKALFGYYIIQDGRFKYVNPRLAEITGYTTDELLNDVDPLQLIHPDHRESIRGNIYRRLDNEDVSNHYSFSGLRKDGSMVHVEVFGSRIQFHGRPAVHGNLIDITETRLTREVLKESEERYRMIIETANEGIWIIDAQNITTFVNTKMSEMLGYTPEDMVGKSIFAFMDEEARGSAVEALDRRRSGLNEQTDFRFRRHNGNTLWTILSTTSIFDISGRYAGLLGMVTDITDRKKAEEQLKYLTMYDSLTGLYNRTYFWEEMKIVEHDRYNPVGLIICDVDGLKLVNDTVGHKSGDTLIADAAQLIQGCFRDDDTVAHIGGDEFAIIVRNTPEWAVDNSCVRIRKAIQRYNAEHPNIPLSISIGWAVRNNSNKTMLELFDEADDAMYREKLHNGRIARVTVVQALMKSLKARYFITEGHANRSQELAANMAECLELSTQHTEYLCILAQFHDIGKVRIPEEILFKPDILNHAEFEEIKRHSEIGHRIALTVPDLAPVADWILKHHEWWDGSGYPLGLKGEDIPLESRIVSIVDAYEAMTSDRPYRQAMSHPEAVLELRKNAGIQFDPELVSKFLEVLESRLSVNKYAQINIFE
ncbi:MAG: PAS domain S-box protein [Acidobacteriota bacterium]